MSADGHYGASIGSVTTNRRTKSGPDLRRNKRTRPAAWYSKAGGQASRPTITLERRRDCRPTRIRHERGPGVPV